MKRFFIPLFLIYGFINLYAEPVWYYNIHNGKPNTFIGFGSAKTEKNAKRNALVDIASQINTKIDKETIQNKNVIAGKYNNDIKIKSVHKTNATLAGYKVINIALQDGLFYVAIEYENIPSLDKFVNSINKEGYTKKSIINSVRKGFGKDLGLELIRKDMKWYVKHENSLQLLDKKDFERFFITKPNPNIEVSTNKTNNILYENDEFFFKVKTSKSGYMTILTVYEDGTVATLMKNIRIDRNVLNNLPDKDYEAVPQAGLMQSGQETFDMYVLILSNSKLILDSFAMADEELIEEERYKNFDELLNFLDNKEYTTLKVVTKPR